MHQMSLATGSPVSACRLASEVPCGYKPPAQPRNRAQKRQVTRPKSGHLVEKSGGVLLSQGESTQVPSALTGLTSVFGMGTGVTPPP